MSGWYLAHHGILGQKWGKRQGPPYPLDPGDHTARERKAGWRKSLSKQNKSDDEKEKNRGLSDKQKKYIKIGAAAVVAGLAVYGGYKLYQSGVLDKYIESGKDALGVKSDVLKRPKVTAENAASFAKNINPSKSTTNCGSTSSAVIENMKGGNVEALSEVPKHMRLEGKDGYDPKKLIDCYEGAKWTGIDSSFSSRKSATKQLEKELLKQGDGATGIFYCEKIRGRSSGHYFSYAIIDNKVHVLEGQPKTAQATGIDWCKDLYNDVGQTFDMQDGNKKVFFARLDDRPVKPDRRKDLFRDRG